jgi:hypothetical protein
MKVNYDIYDSDIDFVDHELKILPEYFKQVKLERKLFEIRKNDRDFKVHNQVALREWTGTEYTGRWLEVEITYITDYEQKDGYIVFGIREKK